MNRRGKTKEGFLHVKQPSRFGKAWKRKWLVIRPNATKDTERSSVLLELYLEKGAYNKTVTSLLLEGITQIRRVISKSQPRAFEFMKGSSVVLTLAGESETEAQDWIDIFKKLLVPATETKELTSITGYGTDVIRVSVVPNKDSERLKLSGNYLAGVSRLQVTLHNAVTGEKVIEWDLRHLKRFMLPSKGPQQDLEKIACLQISNRSPQGEGEYLFHSPNAKPLVEAIYERLSSAITVKERRSRTSSMLFEIPPKELEQLAKAIQEGGDPDFVMVSADGSLEDEAFEKKENGENGEAKTNGDADVKTNGDNHVEESPSEESPAEVKGEVENGQKEGTQENGQNEEMKTDAEDVTKESTADETPADVDEVDKENGLAVNGDSESPKDEAEVEAPGEAEGVVTVDGEAKVEGNASLESSDNIVEEAAQSETPVEEVNGNVENAKNTESEQPVQSSPVIEASAADDSTNAAPIETQDFAAGPIDAEDEDEELAEGAVEVQPRMPPGSEEPEQDSEVVESQDGTEKKDERTVETVDNVEISSEVEVEKPSAEENNQVEISTDTQDIAIESAAVEDNQQQSVPTEETEISVPSAETEVSVPSAETEVSVPSAESIPAESPVQADESTKEAVATVEPVQSDSAEAGEATATEESPAVEVEAQAQSEAVHDESGSSVEQPPSSTSEEADDTPEKTTSTSNEETQNDKVDPSPSESVEPVITDEGKNNQEKVEEISDNSAVSVDNDTPKLVVETIEPPIVDDRIRSQDKLEDALDKNEQEDTAM